MIEQGLKERLTGAVVLMIAAVIFVPWLLDGPDQPAPASEQRTLVLPVASEVNKQDPNSRSQAVSSPAGSAGKRAEPGASGKRAASADEKVTAAPVKPPVAATSQTEARPPPPDPLRAWAVQVGSFASKDNAERLSELLKSRGYRAFVARTSDQGRTLYRVRVGPEQDRARAEALARRLQKDGQEVRVLRHP